MKRLNHRGFTLVEAIASFVIVSIVLTTAAILIVNARNQSVATSRQVDAVQVGSIIRDEIADVAYASVLTWQGGAAKNLTSGTCAAPGSPFSCAVFAHQADGILYDTEVVVAFAAPTVDSQLYKVIRFTVVITYYDARTVVIEGMIYDD
ncbi:MAG: type II secretion system GspH family protein [Comamonadaceae bacterium]|nr:type II secretion system GspH family protein [Comamonadaceae bacterium]